MLLCWSAHRIKIHPQGEGLHPTPTRITATLVTRWPRTPRVPTRTFRHVVLGITGVRWNESPATISPSPPIPHEQPLVERHWTYAANKLRPMTLVLEGCLQRSEEAILSTTSPERPEPTTAPTIPDRSLPLYQRNAFSTFN